MRPALTFFLLLSLYFNNCSAPTSGPEETEATFSDAELGQLIMVGFRGKTIEEVSPEIKAQISSGQVGHYILFDFDYRNKVYDRNVASNDQLAQLNADLQALASQPMLAAIDQEGGRVLRLKPRYGFDTIPSAAWMGSQENLDSTYHYARLNARNLAATGFNVNFAPTVDLAVNPDNPVIAKIERSFGADTARVIRHAQAWIAAHDSLGLLSVLKHFPGHGSSTSDSHKGITDVTTTWTPQELVPFRELLHRDYLVGVMTAHVFNRSIDSIYPATLSPHYITDILREAFQHDGLVFSDDLHMKAVHEIFDFETIIEQSLLAGVDILVFGNNLEYDEAIAPKTITVIRQLLADGRISAERIEKSLARIATARTELR